MTSKPPVMPHDIWMSDPLVWRAYADFIHFEENFLCRNGQPGDRAMAWSGSKAREANDAAMAAARARIKAANSPLSDVRAEKLSCVDVRGDQLTLWLYGPLGSLYAEMADALREHPDKSAILLRIDSHGGSLDMGLHLARCLRNHKARKLAVIDRSCWSAATLAAVACDRIFIREAATMMVHRCSRAAFGNADDLMEAARQIRQSDAECQRFMIGCRGRRLRVSLGSLWSKEQFLTPHEAVAYGLADRVIHSIPSLSGDTPPRDSGLPPEARFL